MRFGCLSGRILFLIYAANAYMIFLVQLSQNDTYQRLKANVSTLFQAKQLLTETYNCSHTNIEVLDGANHQYLIDDSLDITHYRHLFVFINIPSNSPQLSIAGGLFSIDNLTIFGKSITLPSVRRNGTEDIDGCTGLTSWDGAVLLAKYMEQHRHLMKDQLVLELGSGTGIGGISAHAAGAAYVLCTDLGYALDNLRHTISLNVDQAEAVTITATRLDWFDPHSYPTPFLHTIRPSLGDYQDAYETRWDVVIAADVVWLAHLVQPLVNTLASVCGPDTLLLLSYQVLLLNCATLPPSSHTHHVVSQ